MSRVPIKLRVTLVFAALMAVVLAATGLFLYLRLGSELDASIDRDLHSRARGLISEIRVSDVGLGEAARSALSGGGESFAQILTPSARLFDAGAQPTSRPALSPGELKAAAGRAIVVDRAELTANGEPERLLARPVLFEGHRLVVVAGTSLGDRADALSSLLTLLLIGGPVALVLASLAAYWTVGRALRPVEAMRSRAAAMSAARSGQRLPVPPARDELHRLGETLNRMLDRLEETIERERAFVDDASHELRTPLAVHKAELEVALRYGASMEELRAAIVSAIEEADRLSRLAEDLLFVARFDKGALALEPERIEVSELFSAVRERLAARAGDAERPIVADAPAGLSIEADRDRVEQALGNLVENALRYGEGPVRMHASTVDGRIELHVTDEGAGFPAEFLPHAFERFRRADAARSTDGSGLGLSIVDAIARAHGGRAGARNGAGGADVWVELRSSP